MSRQTRYPRDARNIAGRGDRARRDSIAAHVAAEKRDRHCLDDAQLRLLGCVRRQVARPEQPQQVLRAGRDVEERTGELRRVDRVRGALGGEQRRARRREREAADVGDLGAGEDDRRADPPVTEVDVIGDGEGGLAAVRLTADGDPAAVDELTADGGSAG